MKDKFKDYLINKHQICIECPSNEEIKELFVDIMALLFPSFSVQRLSSVDLINERIDNIQKRLEKLLTHHPALGINKPYELSHDFLASLENIETQIGMDIEAIYMGDPAAKSNEEIVRSYPGFYAIAAYRIAHCLHNLGVSVLPRMITELAHCRTGIDIHPGAQIGHSFCIDHGTGVVIGETTIIGHNVKLYQGVTLGALSVDKVSADSKRHPTIEHNTIVYANATILGGQTVIGHHCVIGGNSWITKSIEPHSTVYYISGDNQIEKKKI